MTSIPASRRARAMILAPRSCPSKPGLATTTRILRAVAASISAGSLEDGGLRVGAEDLLHRRDHLSLRGAGAGGGDDRRHQVLLRRGCTSQLGKGALHSAGVASSASRLQAIDLLALQRRVDAQDRGRLFALLDEVVDADDDPLTLVDLALIGESGVGDLALGEVAADRLDHPAQLVDAGEVLIRRPLHLVGL